MLKGWGDITLSSYIEVIDSVSNVDDIFEVLSIVFDKPLDEIESLDYDIILDMEKEVEFIFHPINNDFKSHITINGYDFYLIPFEELEFGAFIDLEHLFSGEYIYNLPKILSILYRRIEKEGDYLNKPTYEDYGDWLNIRDSIFEMSIIEDVYGVISSYLKFKISIYSTYDGLFEETDEDLNEEEETEMLRDMTGKEREEYYNEKNVAGYGWELMLLRLSNNDPTKMLEATSMKVYQALNVLGMMKNLKMG